MKKVVSLILSLLMMFSIATSALAAPSTSKKVLQQSNEQRPALTRVNKLQADLKAEGLKDNDQVRVIVELKGKPAIEYATEKGLKVTQLDSTYLNTITDGIMKEQSKVKQEITTKRIPAKFHFAFSNVTNGFSATVSYGDAKKIEAMPDVERVVIANEYERPEPNMGSSKDLVKAIETWNLGYNGEGTIISIIDTGIDYDHKDMRLTDPLMAKLDKRLVDLTIRNKRLDGQWYTSKVPYGYNYYDHNNIVKDLGTGASMHGMHVAGIAGANGTDEKSVKGVAPEAQLLAMKVFSNDQSFKSTFSDVYLAAIEDSIKLGADAINMSLGSAAGFQRPDDPEQVALTKATRNGIVLAISAGNSGNIGYGFSQPYAKNPDSGVVGSPGLNPDSIQVASIENTNIFADAISYKNGIIGYLMAGTNNPISAFSGQVEYVDCKLGLIGTNNGVPVDDFKGVDVAGKIALVMRGGYDTISGNFVDKIVNAQNKGATGIIVYNHESGGEELINMKYPENGAATIPALFIGYNGGTSLKTLIATNENKISFNGEKLNVSNPNSGKMSAFSSWGATPNLDFKPELTAPGGSIYSTVNDNSYEIMSGTSMAAPHVAGGSALILQRVDKEFGLTGYDRSLMAKNLLLSTATPVVDKGLYNGYYGLGNFVSPRLQGAGVMNLQAAATTPAIVTDNSTGISKVNLLEMGNVETFKLKVTNFSDSPVVYDISGTVTTPLTDEGILLNETQGVYKVGTISGSSEIGEFPISYTQNGAPITSITVPANATTEFDVTVDLTNTIDWWYKAPLDLIFDNGTFIEGFVSLKSADDTQPTIGIPYMGFYGEWDKAPIIDDNNYDPKADPFYGYNTALTWLNKAEKLYQYLGHDINGVPDANNIAFSPNGDGRADEARLLATFLRNAGELEINILDKDGNQIKALSKDFDIRKNYFDSGDGSTYQSNDSWAWDGTVGGHNEVVPDGEYIYQIKAKIDYENADWQVLEFPVKVDTQAPVIESLVLDPATKLLTAIASDNHKMYYYELTKDGELAGISDTGIFDVSSLINPNERNIFVVKAYDYAENTAEKTYEPIIGGDDTQAPSIFIDAPEVLGIYDSNEIVTSGYLTDNAQIRELKINGEIVPTNYNVEKKKYAFEHVLRVPNNGSYIIKYEATDLSGNVMSIERKIFVDTTAPIINLTIPETVGPEVDTLQITGTVTDNMPGLKVLVDGNMVYNSNADWMYIDGESPVTYDFSDCAPINLEFGSNTFVVEARDDAGHSTVMEYTVYRSTEVPVSILNATVTPNKNITYTAPAVLAATANTEVDWVVTIYDYRGMVVETYTAQGTKTFNATWTPTERQIVYGKYRVEFKAIRGDKTDVENVSITTKAPRR